MIVFKWNDRFHAFYCLYKQLVTKTPKLTTAAKVEDIDTEDDEDTKSKAKASKPAPLKKQSTSVSSVASANSSKPEKTSLKRSKSELMV